MFLGRFEHSIDQKGRLTVPARFRDLLVEGAYITQGFDKNLMVLPQEAFEKISQRINQLSLTDPKARVLKRLIFSNADFLELDKVGRILIPQFLRDAAFIESKVVVVGAGGFFEVWSPEIWQTQNEILQDINSNPAQFEDLDLTI
jgi:MraZ protein